MLLPIVLLQMLSQSESTKPDKTMKFVLVRQISLQAKCKLDC